MRKAEWQWDEMRQIGTDYSDLKEVELYDQRMKSFRDVDHENQEMLSMLQLPKGSAVLEIGCGTGQFSRAAASSGLKVSAVDVSKIMLDYVQKKVSEENLPPIILRHAGFLTLDFPSGSFDAVVSGVALHHLPDLWKFVALQNISRVLKPGGKFILRDAVFVLKEGTSPDQCFEGFMNSFNEQARPGALGHVKQEFSTYDWIMDGLLTRAGFKIRSKKPVSSNFIVYLCQI